MEVPEISKKPLFYERIYDYSGVILSSNINLKPNNKSKKIFVQFDEIKAYGDDLCLNSNNIIININKYNTYFVCLDIFIENGGNKIKDMEIFIMNEKSHYLNNIFIGNINENNKTCYYRSKVTLCLSKDKLHTILKYNCDSIFNPPLNMEVKLSIKTSKRSFF